MKKFYISDLIGTAYYDWSGRKIILIAPTGMGKSTFCMNELLPYYKLMKKKVCILYNRKALGGQYFNQLLWYFRIRREMDETVAIHSYQELAEIIKNNGDINEVLSDYALIICDEAHYFYQDSDFNQLGTHILLQELVRVTFNKTVLWMSATMTEVEPMITKCIQQCGAWFGKELYKKVEDFWERPYGFDKEVKNNERYSHILKYDYTHFASYDHFIPVYYENEKALVTDVVNSEGKSIIFVDDRKKAESYKKQMLEHNEINSSDILLLDSHKLDDDWNSQIIQQMLCTNKLPVKILITTSVLDNGFSFHDEEIKNLVIFTESRISFLQMVGRVRTESCNSCRLIIAKRDYSYFKKRVDQYEKMLSDIKSLKDRIADGEQVKLLQSGWYGNTDHAEFIRKMVGITHRKSNYYNQEKKKFYFGYNDYIISFNLFAEEKIANMHLEECRLRQKVTEDPVKVAEYQVEWIGKSTDELIIEGKEYTESRVEEFKKLLLSIDNYTLDQLKKLKDLLIKNYHKDMFPDIPVKGESFSKEKFIKICSRYGLRLETDSTKEGTRYSVKEVIYNENYVAEKMEDSKNISM